MMEDLAGDIGRETRFRGRGTKRNQDPDCRLSSWPAPWALLALPFWARSWVVQIAITVSDRVAIMPTSASVDRWLDAVRLTLFVLVSFTVILPAKRVRKALTM
jgi:hypothetical protein